MAEPMTERMKNVMEEPKEKHSMSPRLSYIAALALLLAIVAGGAYVRLWHLTPPARGILVAPDTDEGAYAFSAQLMLNGQMPYRDFFATLPPAGIYLFAAVLAPFGAPSGSLTSFMALRYASVCYGLATIVVVYAIGRRLGGRWTGLLAAAVLAADGVVADLDRRAMLEAPMNLFSALAVLAYVGGMLRNAKSARWMALAGGLSAVAVMVKSPAAVMPILLVGFTIARRRWSDLGYLILGGAAAGLLLAGPFLIACPEPFLKQVYGFQTARPPDGVLSSAARLTEIWGYPYSWLTLRLCGLGLVAALGLRWREKEWAGWLLVALWAGGSLALIVLSRSYWGTYYSQLATPLALLAGGIVTRSPQGAEDGSRTSPADRRLSLLRRWAPVVALAVFAVWGAAFHAGVQIGATRTLLSFSKPPFDAVRRYLGAHAGPTDAVLATDPLYAMLAERPFARGSDRPYLADSYGGMLYQNLGLADMSWVEMRRLRAEIDGRDAQTDALATATFHKAPAQAEVLAAFENAAYVVVDRRARRQWSPATLARIESETVTLLAVDDVELRARGGEGDAGTE